ncbi:MAG: MFS transporter [Alphaproteobacteria bacterium]|jgi:MFS family permease
MTAPAATAGSLRQDARVIGLVTSAHFCSHFYQLVLPSLFVFMADNYGYSYTQLGLLVGVFSIMSAVAQTPLGMMVDKIGARWPLILATGTLGATFVGYGMVGSYEGMMVLAVIGGTANAVFHPADFSILAARVDEKRVGRAFSFHAISGNIGWALAPIIMIPLAKFFGLEMAFIIGGCIGLAVAAVLITQVNHLETDADKPKTERKAVDDLPPEKKGLRLLLSRAALLLLGFQIINSMAFGGIRNFTIPALDAITSIDPALIAIALTSYLIGSSFGNLAGGFAADRYGKPQVIFTVNILIIAALTALIGLIEMPAILTIGVFATAGTLNGMLLPVRDLLVRAVAPKGQMGTLYGFTSSGLSLGNAVTPVVFGWVMDNGDPRWIFYASAILMLLALATYTEARGEATKN